MLAACKPRACVMGESEIRMSTKRTDLLEQVCLCAPKPRVEFLPDMVSVVQCVSRGLD